MKAIPTIGPSGIQFRSRIEAKWAYLFEALKWNWEYEPIDLEGYIPDFIITFPNNKQILVEVKGDMNIWENYKPHVTKIVNSGWRGHFLIVGSTVRKAENTKGTNVGVGGKISSVTHSEDYDFDNYIIRALDSGWIIGGDTNTYDLALGDPENDGRNWKRADPDSHDIFKDIWIDCQNRTQWNGKQNPTVTEKPPLLHMTDRGAYKAMINLNQTDFYRTLDGDTNHKCVFCGEYSAGKGFSNRYELAQTNIDNSDGYPVEIPVCDKCYNERDPGIENGTIIFPDKSIYKVHFWIRANS